MDQITQQLLNALVLGSIYALIALGYTMVYGIVRLINFAHGDVLMLGAFAGYFSLSSFGDPKYGLIFAFLISMVVAAFIGMGIEKAAYKPLRNAPKINVLITAIGVSIIIENAAKAIPRIGPFEFIGSNYKAFPTPTWMNENILEKYFHYTKLTVTWTDIVVIGLVIILTTLLVLIIKKTRMGKAMRAVSQDANAARLMGINVNNVISFTFALGAALAAAAGILYACKFPQLGAYMGMTPGLKAFVAAVLGGIGSVPGAVIGGFVIAFAETLTKGFISTQLANAVSFLILILILIFKPGGIMGKNLSEKV